jgi:hypothetical protein
VRRVLSVRVTRWLLLGSNQKFTDNRARLVMKLPATILRTDDGQWSLRHESAEIGRVEVTAPTREQAVEKLCG